MSAKNKMCVLSAFLLCVFLFAGCSLMPDGNASVKETTDTEKIKGAELSALQSEIIGSNSAVGIAFVDYVEDGLSGGDVAGYLINSELAEKYPFLKEIKTVAYNGLELFVLVPASDNGVITVYPNTINDKGELEANRDEVIFKGKKGEAVALRCNINESYPNVLVSVTQGDTFLEFYPTISLRDGWSVALQDGCYDFSLDDIRKYTSEAYDMLYKSFPEIQRELDRGKELVFADSFYFCNQWMLRFELGEYTADELAVEKQYAVSFDATYAMNMTEHNWYVIGAGLK